MDRALFLLFYTLAAFPTYILPWIKGFTGGLALMGATPVMGAAASLYVLHAGLLFVCIVAAYLRSKTNKSAALPFLPAAAAAFDLIPGLNFIPFVPSVLHIFALIVGYGSGQGGGEAAPPFRKTFKTMALLFVAVIGVSALSFVAGNSFGRKVAAVQTESRKSTIDKGNPTSAPARLNPWGSGASGAVVQPPLERRSVPLPGSSSPDATPGSAAPLSEEQLRLQEERRRVAEERRQQELLRQKQEAEARESAARAERERIDALNRYVHSPDATAMARKYVESYVGFLAADDIFTAIGLFSADRNQAESLRLDLKRLGGPLAVEFTSIRIAKRYGKQDGLRLEFTVRGPRGSSLLRSVTLSVTDDGSKFVQVI